MARPAKRRQLPLAAQREASRVVLCEALRVDYTAVRVAADEAEARRWGKRGVTVLAPEMVLNGQDCRLVVGRASGHFVVSRTTGRSRLGSEVDVLHDSRLHKRAVKVAAVLAASVPAELRACREFRPKLELSADARRDLDRAIKFLRALGVDDTAQSKVLHEATALAFTTLNRYEIYLDAVAEALVARLEMDRKEVRDVIAVTVPARTRDTLRPALRVALHARQRTTPEQATQEAPSSDWRLAGLQNLSSDDLFE